MNILFVCIGNICRSPMAEGYFKKKLKGKRVKISSAGLRAMVGKAAVSESQEVMKKNGVNISKHRARQLTEKMVLDADLVLVMEMRHLQELRRAFPHWCGKVHLLGKWGNFEVPDPYDEDIEEFEKCFELIRRGCEDWQQRIM